MKLKFMSVAPQVKIEALATNLPDRYLPTLAKFRQTYPV